MGDGGRGDDDVIRDRWVMITSPYVSKAILRLCKEDIHASYISMGMGVRSAIAVYHDINPS